MAEKKKAGFGKWLVIGAVLVVVLILGAGLYFFGFLDNKQAVNQKNEAARATAQSTGKTFNKEELAKYNGKDEVPAYLAVEGVVYDLSVVFKNGVHHSHLAGQDLTESYLGKHAANRIQKYPIKGLYIK